MEATAFDAHRPLALLPEMHRSWRWFVVVGLVVSLLGLLGVAASMAMTLVSVVFLGVLLVVAGVGLAAHAMSAARWSGFFLQLLSALLYLVVGWLCITRPATQAVVLTLLLAISLVVQGTFRIVAALVARVDGRGPLLASGAITLVLGLMIWNQWPEASFWVIGLFAGIDLLFYGFWLVSIGLSVRRPAPTA